MSGGTRLGEKMNRKGIIELHVACDTCAKTHILPMMIFAPFTLCAEKLINMLLDGNLYQKNMVEHLLGAIELVLFLPSKRFFENCVEADAKE